MDAKLPTSQGGEREREWVTKLTNQMGLKDGFLGLINHLGPNNPWLLFSMGDIPMVECATFIIFIFLDKENMG